MTLGTLHIKMPDGQTREFAVEQAAIGAGRASENELVLDDISVSRRHARLTFAAGQMAIEDQSSANGVFVGGRRLPPNVPTPVPAGATIQIGDVELSFEPAAPAMPAPPPGSSAEAATVILPSPTVIKGEAKWIAKSGKRPLGGVSFRAFQRELMSLSRGWGRAFAGA